MSGYKNDVFLSYSRSRESRLWVERYFEPTLRQALESELGRPPALFVDRQLTGGAEWPAALRDELLRSRCLVAVLGRPYWSSAYSGWCKTEFYSMLERAKALGRAPADGLVYAIQFHDGDYYPAAAKAIQLRDFRRYRRTSPAFELTPAHADFEGLVQEVSEEVAQMVERAPDWAPGWPILEHHSEPQPAFAQAVLR